MTNTEENASRDPAAAVKPKGFAWYYRLVEPDHVIALCDGHSYLAGRGWRPGEGNLAPLRPADGCCVCMGFATIKRMRGAPLKPSEVTKKEVA